jgi:bile acid-coenzyme A ligase
LRLGQTQLVALPLHHSAFTALYHGLALDHRIVLMERFEATQFCTLIERQHVNVVRVVPAMMRLALASPAFSTCDLTSLEAVHQGGATCAPGVKRAWLEVIGAKKVYEGYSSQERIGAVWIRGDEWLDRQGSVGKPKNCEIRILGEDGAERPNGAIGEIYIRSAFSRQPEYLGDGPPLPERDGYFSLGDMGYLDADGYLYILDRRVDMINVGGTNVYPAEIERVLLEQPDVLDAAVVGIEHAILGRVPCAFIVPAVDSEPPRTVDLYHHCRARLALAKVPARYVICTALPRSENGKICRSALVDAWRQIVTPLPEARQREVEQ